MSGECYCSDMGIPNIGRILAGSSLPPNIDQGRLFQEIADIVNIELANEGTQYSVTADEMADVRKFYQSLQLIDYPTTVVEMLEIDIKDFHDPEFYFQLNNPAIDDENFRKLSINYNKIKRKLPSKLIDAIRKVL